MGTKELLYSLRQVRYWANRADKLAEAFADASDASDIEKEGNKEKEKSPCTPLKEKETKGEKELSLQRVRVRGGFVPPAIEEVAAIVARAFAPVFKVRLAVPSGREKGLLFTPQNFVGFLPGPMKPGVRRMCRTPFSRFSIHSGAL